MKKSCAWQRAEGRGQEAEGRRQEAKGRRSKADRRTNTESSILAEPIPI